MRKLVGSFIDTTSILLLTKEESFVPKRERIVQGEVVLIITVSL